jgi:hypothetical protein
MASNISARIATEVVGRVGGALLACPGT